MGGRLLCSLQQEALELLNGETRLPNQGTKRPRGQLGMVRDGKGLRPSDLGQDDVAASLPGHAPAEVFERSHDL